MTNSSSEISSSSYYGSSDSESEKQNNIILEKIIKKNDAIKINDNTYILTILISKLQKYFKKNLFLTWEYNRNLDQDRINKIKLNITLKNDIDINGVISFCFLNDLFYLIDGQHRLQAYFLINNENKKDFIIPIQIYISESELKIRDKFIFLNKSISVPLAYIEKNDIINSIFDNYEQIYPKLFTRENGKKRPTINIINLKSSILEKKVLNFIEPCNEKTFINYFELFNKFLSKYSNNKLIEIINNKLYYSDKAKNRDIIILNNLKLKLEKITKRKDCFLICLFIYDNWIDMFLDFIKIHKKD